MNLISNITCIIQHNLDIFKNMYDSKILISQKWPLFETRPFLFIQITLKFFRCWKNVKVFQARKCAHYFYHHPRFVFYKHLNHYISLVEPIAAPE